MTRRRVALAALACAAAGLGVVGTPTAVSAKPIPGSASILVRAIGKITTAPDGTRTSTLAVSPATVTLKTLDRLGWKDRDSINEPHLFVFTTDASKVLGRTIDDGQACDLCDTAKSEMAAALAANPDVTRVEHGDPSGLDVEGDAYLDRLGDDVWMRVKAPAGTVFYYMDAYHPWEHGEVDVTS